MDLPSPVEVDFKSNGGSVVFRTVEDVRQWLENEKTFYRFLGSENPLRGDFQRSWQNVEDLIGDWRPGRDIERNMPDLKARLERFAEGGYIHSSRPEAQFAASLSSPAGSIALAVIAQRGNQQGTRNAEEVGAVVRAVLYQLGITSNVESQKDALDKLREGTQAELAKLKQDRERFLEGTSAEINDASARHEAARVAAVKRFDELADEGAKNAAERKEAWEQHKVSTGAELKSIEDTFRTQMALQQPVQYWRDRQQQGRKRAMIWGGLTAGWMVVVVVVAALAAHYLLGQQNISGWSWKYVPLAIVITLFLWVARSFAKLFWANAHLEADAAQRVVLMQAYLALNAGGNADATTRKLALEALFRRGSTGLVGGDDAVTPWEILTKVVAGRG